MSPVFTSEDVDMCMVGKVLVIETESCTRTCETEEESKAALALDPFLPLRHLDGFRDPQRVQVQG